MGMRVSQAVAKAKDVTVEFEGGAELAVTYRPLSYTVRQMDEMQAEQAAAGTRATRRILETIQNLVVTWDLEAEDGTVIPLKGDLDERGPAAKGQDEGPLVHPLRDVPSHIFTAIIQAVNEDQKPGGSKPSGA